jgi:hypothetical protein
MGCFNMKTELRSGYASDEKGIAVFVTLILLFVVTIAGLTILTIAGRDRIASSDMSVVRGASEAANTALDACENQILQKSPLMTSVLNKYLKDKTYKWFFSTDSLGANKEKKVTLGEGYSYSAEIMAYDTGNNVLQVRGIGYGRSNEQKSVIAQYRLSGIQKISGAAIPRYALYLAGQGRNFDIPIDITGDVYIGKDFHFNSNALNSRLRGFLKTGVDIALTSGIDAVGLVIDSGIYIGTGLKMNSNPFTCDNKFGIEGNLELDRTLTIKKNAWFNGSITGNAKVDMNGNIIYHSGSVSVLRVMNYSNMNNLGPSKITDIAQKIGVNTTNDSAWGVDTTGLNAVAYALGKYLDAAKLNTMYQACAESRKKNGYMVVYDSAGNVQIDPSADEFKGKVIFLLRYGLNINGYFPNMSADSRVLIIGTGQVGINGFGGADAQTFNGLVYLKDTCDMKTQAYGTYTINGAIHLAGVKCKWQMNNVLPSFNQRIIFKYNPAIISEFVSMGIINIPAPGGTPSGVPGTLKLTDFKIRTTMLSVSY